jgi:hypothetical protein
MAPRTAPLEVAMTAGAAATSSVKADVAVPQAFAANKRYVVVTDGATVTAPVPVTSPPGSTRTDVAPPAERNRVTA